MQQDLETKTDRHQKLKESVFSTLAFFALYEVPVTFSRVHELLVKERATAEEVQMILNQLVADDRISQTGNLYSLKPWKASDYRDKQVEISKKWMRIDRYYFWLAILPFVRLVSVINSLSLGTADKDSDIDFFVVTSKNRLYFVRSIIIVLFRILGVYKTRTKIKDRFCFGFFVTKDNLNFKNLLIKPEDPYFINWLANMRPVTDGRQYWELMQQNPWLAEELPNFNAMQRLTSIQKPNLFIRGIKLILEVILFIPAALLEPMLRKIHIDHTFKLAENHAVTSTTIANEKILKLHGHDVRSQIARAHLDLLKSLR